MICEKCIYFDGYDPINPNIINCTLYNEIDIFDIESIFDIEDCLSFKKQITYNRDFDTEIDKILNDKDLNLGKGKRRYYLYKLLNELKDKLNLKTYDPN